MSKPPAWFDVRLAAAIAAGKAAGLASRVVRAGGGTTLPGVVARRIAPNTLRLLTARLAEGVVLIAGTNGKTTTARMLATVLSASGRRVLHNRAGANLLTGLTATAIAGASIAGRLQAEAGLFEIDEAALPGALAETGPRLVVLHNLFRDQLDRYGEVDTIARHWRAALETLSPAAVVLLNADDPAIAALGEGLAARVRYYGLDDPRHSGGVTYLADSQFCRRCGARYAYSAVFYGHVGHYACPRCGHVRPAPDYRLVRLDTGGAEGSRLFITWAGGALELSLPLPGIYNAMNALAAAAAALSLGVAPALIRDTLARFHAAFGRIERVDAGGKPLLLVLIKNPVGASETVRMLTSAQADVTGTAAGHLAMALNLLIAINDRHADGTDVSWLWDADFERLAGRVDHVVVSGTRAHDMAVRLKYAGIEPDRIVIEADLDRAIDAALAHLPDGATLYTLPTYTAMLELRAVLARRGWVRPFWEE